MVTIGLLPWLTTLGLPAAMTRFLAAATDKREIPRGLLLHGIRRCTDKLQLIISGLLFLFVPQIAASLFHNDNTIALLLIPNILLACLTLYVIEYFTTLQKIKTHSFLTIFNAYLNTALIAFFILLGHGLEGAVIALLIQQLVVFAVMLYLIVAQIGVAIPKFRHIRQYWLLVCHCSRAI